MASVLKITDGTDEIDLLDANGWLLETWTVAVPQAKGGGTYQQSSLSDGRRLVNRVFDTMLESFSLKCGNQPDQDTAIFQLQELERLLEKAVQYWTTDWQNEPVWIEAQAKCETELRYAVIQQYSIPELRNWYEQPFAADPVVIDDVTLILERLHWQADEPGTGTATLLAMSGSYDGRTLGTVDDTGAVEPTTDRVVVANKRVIANLTDIYIEDGAVFGANLMDAALPFNLYPAVPATNDRIYFGIDTALDDSGPFCSLVFDIGTIQNDLTIAWQYWNGAWVALSVKDNTDSFQETGRGAVHWTVPADWVTTAVNGVTGYWVRAVATVGAAPSPPTQQNRDIYTAIWPYVEIDVDDVVGDIPAIVNWVFRNLADDEVTWGDPDLKIMRIVGGLRSLNRGEDFTAYINLADEQNPAAFTLSVFSSASFATYVQASTGRSVFYNPAGVEASNQIIQVLVDRTLISDFYGKYHVFVRAKQVGGSAGDIGITWRARHRNDGKFFISDDEVFFESTNVPQILDLGTLTIPVGLDDMYINAVAANTFVFQIYASNSNAAPGDVYFYDLILMPIDEIAFDAQQVVDEDETDIPDLHSGTGSQEWGELSLDSLLVAKGKRGLVRQLLLAPAETTAGFATSWIQIVNSSYYGIQANRNQRLWILLMSNKSQTAFEGWYGTACHAIEATLTSSARYISARGER
jgi:hypothetical protein